MVFTEIKERNNNKYYYRVFSYREKDKVSKKRIYVGKNLSGDILKEKTNKSDSEIYSIKRKMRGNEFEEIKNKVRKMLKKKGVKKAGIFGSYARGEQRKNSDVDILVKLNSKINGFAFFGLQDEISQKINKKVDLVTYGEMDGRLKDRILNQEVRII